MRLRRAYVGFLFCPKCGEWRESAAATKAGNERKNLCRVCGYDFGEVTDSMRLDRRVSAVVCPSCGTEIPCTEGNIMHGIGGVKELFCPMCHFAIARHINRKWVEIQAPAASSA